MKKVANSNLSKQKHVGVAWYATQNNQSHVGAGPVSAQNAITLVALVITVIILLILAGVTINLTLGNNGIFKTAQQAAKNYTEAQNKELADLNEFENIVDKIAQNPEYNPSLLKLKPGDYVKYDTGVKEAGDNGVAIFRVLYDATSEYGLQIISDKNIQVVPLGGSNWKIARDSFNDAIKTLNKEAMKYKNDTYAINARCVGNNPKNKIEETIGTVTLPRPEWENYTRPTGWTSDDTGCKDINTKEYIIDTDTMDKFKILYTGQVYWLASPFTSSYTNGFSAYVRTVNGLGNLSADNLCDISHGGWLGAYIRTYGLRPCITLKPDITITSGDGASEATAYTLGI